LLLDILFRTLQHCLPVAVLSQLGLRYFRQQQFRKANPMSVMIDLSRKKL